MKLTEEQLKSYESIYHLYLDETGHSVFNPRKVYNDVKGRYLTLGGVFIRGDIYWTQLYPAINQLKQDYFGTTDFILHYTELFFTRGTRSLDSDKQQAFWRDFLEIIACIDLQLLSITIDKQRFQNKTYLWLYDPYHLILAWHIERVVFALSRIERLQKIIERGKHPLRARIVIEARGGNQDAKTGQEGGPDRRLATSYRRLFKEGSKIFQTVTPKEIQKRLTSNEISIADKKANKVGLQVADLMSFPMHWNTLFELCPEDIFEMKGEIRKSANVELFWEKAREKIAVDASGHIEGFGIKLFPDKSD